MRKLMWFTLGFALACAVRAYLLPDGFALPAIALLFLVLLSVFLKRGRRQTLPAIAVCVGCLVGVLWFAAFQQGYLNAPEKLEDTQQTLTIHASDYSYETNYGIAVDGILMLEGKPYQVRTYLNEMQPVEPGQTVTGSFRFRITTPDGADTYHPGKGIFLLAYQRGGVQVETPEKLPWWCAPAIWRHQIKQLLRSSFPEDVYPFVKALLLGDSYDLSYETDTALKISGIRHIVAVSGLHISILYGLLCLLTGRNRVLTALIGLPMLLLFAALAGFTPSVSRGCIMVGLMILSTLLNREYDPPTELSFAALVMLVANPLVITSVSFQLSVGCVAGILLFHTPISQWLNQSLFRGGKGDSGIRKWITASISISISAMSLTTPLCACYFGTVSIIGVITNLLTLWVITFLFDGIIAVCVLSLLWHELAALLGSILAWVVRYVLFVAKALASIPFAAVYTESGYIVLWLVLVYIFLAVFLLGKRKKPGVLICSITISLCFALLASCLVPLCADCRITMLDVGQGQAIILQSQGRTYLVDCGGDEDEAAADLVAQTLLSQGITRLDGIVVTHYDQDHFGGLQYLLTRIQTDVLFVPDMEDAGKLASLPPVDGELLRVKDAVELRFGTAAMWIYGPVYSGYDNENSLCVLFDTEKCDILITGDRSGFGERMLMRKASLPDVDILVAGHHGAKTSTTKELLHAANPELVLISVAADNAYGHPHPELLQRLEAFGCTVLRTDENGTIRYRR